MTTGQRIAQRRKQLSLSQEALGERLGLSRQAVSKWEADAAIPEVDKLIALSKLFSVSVGWLLGVEEDSVPDRPREELTDAQLQLVEEIVGRYLERKAETAPVPREKWWRVPAIVTAIAAAVLVLTVVIVRVGSGISSELREVPLLQDSNLIMVDRLDSLELRVNAMADQLAEQIENQTRILSNWDLEVTGREDMTGGTITFTAAPKTWQEGDEGVFSVQLDGVEVARETGVWNGTIYTATVELTAADGYYSYFILCHADGSQEYQALNTPDNLEHYYGIYLTEGLTAQFDGRVNVWDNSNGLLSVTDWEIEYISPGLFAEAEGFRARELRYVILVNGAEADNEPVDIQGIRDRNQIGLCSSGQLFQRQLKPGDELELRFELELENGTVLQDTAGRWSCGEYMDIEELEDQ